MEKKDHIVAVDLGSSCVSVAVGEKSADGLVKVVSVVTEPVEGVNAGMIENIELVGKAIGRCVERIGEELNLRITEAYAGISGDFVRCARHTDHVFALDPQNSIVQQDVDALFARMRNVQAPDEEVIMERVPQNYMVDNRQEVRNPVGSFGKKLSSTFNFILCHRTPLQRLEMALKRVGIRMLGAFSNAVATPEAVLTPDEKEEGVVVVDMGGGVTDVTVYYRNVVRYIASIPIGASAINTDIRSLSVPEKYVESLKQRYGSAVAELAPKDKLVRVNAHAAKDILLYNLAQAIEARATDIVEFVQQEIEDSGYGNRLTYGIVLTGGSARLKDLDELFKRITDRNVRIALPVVEVAEGLGERISDPALSTVVGILLKGSREGACKTAAHSQTPPTPIQPGAPAATTPVQPGTQTTGTPPQPGTPDGDGMLPPPDSGRRKRWKDFIKKPTDWIDETFKQGDDEEI